MNNINGYTSKKESLSEIIKVYQPDIIGLCETKLGKKEELTVDGYEGISSNYKKGQEGLYLAVKKGTYWSIEPVSEGGKTSCQHRLSIQK